MVMTGWAAGLALLAATSLACVTAAGQVPADRHALVYKGMPPNHNCVDQALRILPGGEWVVVFMTGGAREPEPANHIRLCRSHDEGRTWGPAEEVLRFPDQACLFSEALLEGGTLTLFVTTHGGAFERWRNWTIASTDGGHTWSAPAPFEALPRRGFVRNVYRATWGEWYLPVQAYDETDDVDRSPMRDAVFQGKSGVLISGDRGATWGRSPRVGPLPGWTENNVVELRDGRLVMLIRADGTGRLYRSDSGDRGRTWSEPVATDIPNPGSKFRLFRLSDGRIVLVHNPNGATSDPNSKEMAFVNRNPLALWISSDDLATWGYQRVLTDFPGMLAYPDGVVDGAEAWVHFAFDYNRHDVIYWGAAIPPR